MLQVLLMLIILIIYVDFTSGLAVSLQSGAFYVVDLLESVNSEAVAITLSKELIEMMKRGGFDLTKFMSNSPTVLESLPAFAISPKMRLDLDTANIQRALGISWDVNSDRFLFTLKLPDAPHTKRGIVRVTCSVFDPMGFLAAFILVAKLLVQELWRRGFGWDKVIDTEAANMWKKWLKAAENVSQVYVDRCFSSTFDDPFIEVQLHIFSAASKGAYVSVAYFRFSFKAGGNASMFAFSKSKLAPLKAINLPQIELNAAVTGARMYKLIIRESDLPVERVVFWTDSTLTLQYIANTTLLPKAYVANRKSEINETTRVEDWRHVPGDINPADLLTCGVSNPSELMETGANDTCFFSGPGFLKEVYSQLRL